MILCIYEPSGSVTTTTVRGRRVHIVIIENNNIIAYRTAETTAAVYL